MDIFGREKHGTYRDDMGGVGSMHRVNRTLYVGRISEDTSMSFRSAGGAKSNVDPDGENSPMAKIVRRHFSEWGEIERVRVVAGRGIAFVTYKYEANAQFAKEAMMHQSLDHNEVLNVRWSTDDPKNESYPREEAALREQGEKQIAAVEEARREEEADYEALRNDSTVDWDEYARAKRRRLALSDAEAARLDAENARGWEAYRAEQAQKAPSKPGLLSDEAVRALAHMKQRSAPVAALPGLAAYESDSGGE